MKINEKDEIKKLDELLTTEEINKSNNISKITDKIYLGDEEGAKELDFFKAEGIHTIISLSANTQEYPDDIGINLIKIEIEDSVTINILYYVKQCIELIEKADKVYIHCSLGINRSPTIVIGYLMWKTHSNYDDVFEFVKKRRDCIEPNNLFIMKLHKFQTMLKKSNYNLAKIDVDKHIKK